MDPVSTELAKEGISKVVEAAKEFLFKIAGPASEEIGLLLQDKVKLYRFKNQLRILAKAEEMLKKSGLNPHAVPFRTLLPILEGAASEDDESLSIKWAALLANSAGKADDVASHPSFPRILSEIAPVEARFLDYLFSSDVEPEWNSFRADLALKFGVTQADINRYHGNLFRLGLVQIGARKGFPTGVLKITSFGKAFMSACSPPESRDT